MKAKHDPVNMLVGNWNTNNALEGVFFIIFFNSVVSIGSSVAVVLKNRFEVEHFCV